MTEALQLQMLDWKYYDETLYEEYRHNGEVKQKMAGSWYSL